MLKDLQKKTVEREQEESETQVSAVKTVSYTDGQSLHFREAAEGAPHPRRNITRPTGGPWGREAVLLKDLEPILAVGLWLGARGAVLGTSVFSASPPGNDVMKVQTCAVLCCICQLLDHARGVGGRGGPGVLQ